MNYKDYIIGFGLFILYVLGLLYVLNMTIYKSNEEIIENLTLTKTLNYTNIVYYNNTIVFNYTTSCPNITLNSKVIQIKEPCSVEPAFAHLLQSVATEHTYILNEYDCSEMSAELSRRLNDAGYDSVTVIVDNGKHMIVKINSPIYVESTTGKIIMPRELKQKYNI